MKGRISFDKLSADELNNAEAWKNKMIARFDLRVPVSMVREVARTVAMLQMKAAANGIEPDPAEVEKTASDMTAVVVGKAVSEGYGRLAHGQLRTTVLVRNGVLTLNGKKLSIPSAEPAAVPVEAPEASPAPAAQ